MGLANHSSTCKCAGCLEVNKWDKILESKGLGMDRGSRNLEYTDSLLTYDKLAVKKSQGIIPLGGKTKIGRAK
jgi:hypothetical protein